MFDDDADEPRGVRGSSWEVSLGILHEVSFFRLPARHRGTLEVLLRQTSVTYSTLAPLLGLSFLSGILGVGRDGNDLLVVRPGHLSSADDERLPLE